jgi:hypothetical protein
MASVDELRRELDKDELDYPALAVAFGEAGLPALQEIVAEDDPRLAPKAAYLAGLIGGPTSHEVIALAARSRHEVVRVAAAAAVTALPTEYAAEITAALLQDPDPGVRVRAAKSARKIRNPGLSARLREMAAQDPTPYVRDLAAEISDRLDGDITEEPNSGRNPRADVAGALAGRTPRVDMTKGAAAGRMPGVDMTESAAAGRMPGIDTTDGAAAGKTSSEDMTKGAAEGRMPGVD